MRRIKGTIALFLALVMLMTAAVTPALSEEIEAAVEEAMVEEAAVEEAVEEPEGSVEESEESVAEPEEPEAEAEVSAEAEAEADVPEELPEEMTEEEAEAEPAEESTEESEAEAMDDPTEEVITECDIEARPEEGYYWEWNPEDYAVTADGFVIRHNEDEPGTVVEYLGDGGNVVVPDHWVENDSSGEVTAIYLSDSDKTNVYSDESINKITHLTIPETVKSISFQSFNDAAVLESVTILGSDLTISGEAFYRCSALKSVKISGDNVQIGRWAFKDCTAMTSVEILGDNVTMDEGAFDYCVGLKSLNIAGSNVHIGEEAFSGPESLSDLKIPGDNITIGKRGFYGIGPVDLVMPGKGLVIGEEAFWCARIQSARFTGSIDSLGVKAFAACSRMETVQLPEGIIEIPDNCFSGCKCLDEFKFPSTVKTIGERAFFDSGIGSDLHIPGTVERIGDYAFSEFNAPNVVIEEGVTTIGEGVFSDGYGIQSITLPASLKTIGYNALKVRVNEFFPTTTAIIVPEGSYAEQYCKENGIQYTYEREDPGTPTYTIICDPATVTLSQKETLTIKATTSGLSKKEKYTFKSLAPSVAAVAKTTGKITAKKPGTATIIVKGKDSGQSGSCVVTVLPAPKKVTLSQTSANLTTDDGPLTLTASIEDADAVQDVTWKSSDTSVATVDSTTGVVTPVGQGSATITATSVKKGTNGKKKSAKCTISVTDPHMPASITIGGETTQYVDLKGTLQLTYSLDPATEDQTAESDVTWSIPTKQQKYADIDPKTGLLTAKDKEGTVTVTVKTEKKGGTGKKLKQLTDTVKVTVVDPSKAREVKIDQGSVAAVYGGMETLQLTAKVIPDTAAQTVTWSIPTKQQKIAKIDENGVITPIASKGTVTVTVTTTAKKANNKPAKATIKVTVGVDPNVPFNVTLDKEGTVELKQGQTLQLSAVIEPAELAEDQKKLSWSSSKSNIASVNTETGLVEGLKAGTTTITVKTVNGKKDTVKIKVVK